MSIASAKLKMFRQSPRKMRLVADAVRGKKVSEALVQLDFISKRAAHPVKKLIESALANAKSQGASSENLIISKIAVNVGPILYRHMPRARGSAAPIRKRTSHLTVELSDSPKSKKSKKHE